MLYAIMTTLALVLVLSVASLAQTPAQSGSDVKAFFSGIVGEWIGTCQQSTDGQQADDKYFHAVIKTLNDSSYQGDFDYYRLDPKTGKPLPIGTTRVVTTVGADGNATSTITGKGIVLVDEKPKNQEHKLTEKIVGTGNNSLQSKGTGTISVSGMPLGLGKNGKVKDSTSNWTMKDDVLYINQKLHVGFRAFIFNKSFDIQANYVAHRGTDVASLMAQSKQASAAKPIAR